MNRARLVLVHPDAWVRATFGGMLREAGYSVTLASNGASGLRLTRQLPLDLALIGPGLAEISRQELRELLADDSKTRKTPVITLGEQVHDHAPSAPPTDALSPALADAYRSLTAALR